MKPETEERKPEREDGARGAAGLYDLYLRTSVARAAHAYCDARAAVLRCEDELARLKEIKSLAAARLDMAERDYPDSVVLREQWLAAHRAERRAKEASE